MSDNPDVNPLEQVQSILFGRQMQEITQRFEALDARLTEKTHEVLGEVRDRVAKLEQASKEREQALRQALEAQYRDGTDGLAKLGSLLDAEKSALRQHVDQLKSDLHAVRKSDRTDLSALFMDVARRLGDDNTNG